VFSPAWTSSETSTTASLPRASAAAAPGTASPLTSTWPAARPSVVTRSVAWPCGEVNVALCSSRSRGSADSASTTCPSGGGAGSATAGDPIAAAPTSTGATSSAVLRTVVVLSVIASPCVRAPAGRQRLGHAQLALPERVARPAPSAEPPAAAAVELLCAGVHGEDPEPGVLRSAVGESAFRRGEQGTAHSPAVRVRRDVEAADVTLPVVF